MISVADCGCPLYVGNAYLSLKRYKNKKILEKTKRIYYIIINIMMQKIAKRKMRR